MSDNTSVTNSTATQTPISQTPISQSGSQGGVLEQEDFLEIMIAELSNQDPFEPMDNREFLGQLTQMQNLEASTEMTTSLQQLATSLEALTFGQQLSSASTLIGQMVVGQDLDGNEVIGVVTSYHVDGGASYLQLEGVQGFGSQLGDESVPSSARMELTGVTEVRGPVLVEITEEEAGVGDTTPTENSGETDENDGTDEAGGETPVDENDSSGGDDPA